MNKKNFRKMALLAIGMIIIELIVYFTFIEKVANKQAISIESLKGEETIGKINDALIEQEFEVETDTINGVSVQLATYAQINEGIIDLSVIDETTGVIYYQERISLAEIQDNTYRELLFREEAINVNNHRFKIEIKIKGNSKNDCITIWAKENDNVEKNVKINGIDTEYTLNYKVYSGTNYFIKNVYWILAIILMAGTCVVYYLYQKNAKLEKIWIVIAAIIGFGYMFILPYGSAPDELAHLDMSYRYSNRLLLIEKPGTSRDIDYKRIDDIEFKGFSTRPNIYTYKAIYDHFGDKIVNSELRATAMTYVNAPCWLYLPSAIGLTIGRLLKFGTVLTYYLGRLFNFGIFLISIYYAIKRTPIGKMAFFSMMLFPMTLQLAVSFSYDSIIISISALFISQVFASAYSNEMISLKKWIFIMGMGALLAPCKGGVYLPICFLVLIIPMIKYSNRKDYKKYIACLIGVIVLSFVLTSLSRTINAVSHTNSSLAWTSEPGFTLSYFFEHPIYFIKIFLNTFYAKGDFYFTSVIGQSLGWLNIPIQLLLVLGFALCFLLGTLSKEEEAISLTIGRRCLSLLICMGSAGLCMLAMLLNWTPMSYKAIEGVQGRYFLPFIPVLILFLQNKVVVLKKKIDGGIIVGLMVLQFLVMIELMMVLLK